MASALLNSELHRIRTESRSQSEAELQIALRQVVEQGQGMLPLHALLTCTHCRAAGDPFGRPKGTKMQEKRRSALVQATGQVELHAFRLHSIENDQGLMFFTGSVFFHLTRQAWAAACSQWPVFPKALKAAL